MVFRVASTDFALTYPQSNGLSQQELFDYLKKQKNITYVLVSAETHKDGSPHLHAHLQYSRRKDIKNQEYFDHKGKHCNIQATRNPDDWNDYCKKDGNFLEWGQLETDLNLYQRARVLNHDDYFELCRSKKICFQYAMEAWRTSQQVDTTIDEDTEINGTCGILEAMDPREPFKSIVIIGPSGVGKTVFAKKRSTKPALFVSHLDQLKSFNPARHKSIIFDDMAFTHIPTTGQIHLVDRYEPRAIHIRYGVVNIPAGIERWFTCNSNPFVEHPAITRRTNKINLY